MRKKKNELSRLVNTLETDRLNVNEKFYNLVSSDLKNLLSEYFIINDAPSVTVEKIGSELKINVSVSAVRVKNFINLPN